MADSRIRRRSAERLGNWGEQAAAWWLRLHGWQIMARRVRQHQGEIDLVARRRRMTIFVEVKTRRTEAELAQAIDEWRLRRVAAAVRQIGHHYARAGDDIRIDVILMMPWRWPRHLVNVWQEG